MSFRSSTTSKIFNIPNHEHSTKWTYEERIREIRFTSCSLFTKAILPNALIVLINVICLALYDMFEEVDRPG